MPFVERSRHSHLWIMKERVGIGGSKESPEDKRVHSRYLREGDLTKTPYRPPSLPISFCFVCLSLV